MLLLMSLAVVGVVGKAVEPDDVLLCGLGDPFTIPTCYKINFYKITCQYGIFALTIENNPYWHWHGSHNCFVGGFCGRFRRGGCFCLLGLSSLLSQLAIFRILISIGAASHVLWPVSLLTRVIAVGRIPTAVEYRLNTSCFNLLKNKVY